MQHSQHLNHNNVNNSNYSMMHNQHQQQQSFVSPLRGAVPTNTNALHHHMVGMGSSSNMRNVSSSPFIQKKRNEKSQQRSGNAMNPVSMTLGHSSDQFTEEDLNRMVSYNQINLDNQERQYYQILESEKQQLKKKEVASREIIAEISRKLKQTEKKATEESKVTLEYKKRHDQMKKKLDKSQKDKQENVNQLKSLFVLFTQQRKALELSIQKSKKLDEDNARLEQRNKNLEEQHKMFYSRIEQLEQDREVLLAKHKRDKDQLQQEVEEKRHILKQYELEYKEIGNQKLMMKKQLDEYENKIKKLILEFEEESKKHIRELNEVHEQYRGYKTTSMELEQRIQSYKADQQKAMQGEREAKKEVHRLRLENDELMEKVRFMDHRYNTLIQKMGVSQEDLQAIDELMRQSEAYYPSNGDDDEDEDEEAQVVQQKHQSKVPAAVPVDQHTLQNMRDQLNNQYAQQQMHLANNYMNQDDEDEDVYGDEDNDEIDPDLLAQAQAQLYQQQMQLQQQQQQQPISGVISGEQTIEQSDNNRNKRQTNIEVLDDEMSLRQYQQQNQQLKLNPDDSEEMIIGGNNGDNMGGSDESESEDLLKKLIENIGGNPALQNIYIRDQFKLDQIKQESDLHDYKNLLNSMAALFYTNHRLSDVTVMFYLWRETAMQKQKEKLMQEQQQQIEEQQRQQQQQMELQNQSSSKKKSSQKNKQGSNKLQPPGGIKIDTDLANQDMYRNYEDLNDQQQLPNFTDEDSPSEIQKDQKLLQNMMIHIEGDEDDQMNPLKEDDIEINFDIREDPDEKRDKKNRRLIQDLKQVGPYSKQILNYTYPPLLYQRGDDEEDEEDDPNADGLPDLVQDYDEDDDIQELIKGGGGGINNEDLYAKLQDVAQGKDSHKKQQYIEQIDDDGNVYLVDPNEYGDEQYEQDDNDIDGRPAVMMGNDMNEDELQEYMDDDEFLQMMEQEAAAGRMNGILMQDMLQQQNSTIINDSQNTSLEEGFGVE
eukprot:403364524